MRACPAPLYPRRRCSALKPVQQAAGAAGGALLLFDPSHDRQLLRGWRQLLASLLACGKDGAQRLMSQGMAYAAALDEAGGLSALYERAAGGGSSGRGDASCGAAGDGGSGCGVAVECVVSLATTHAAGKCVCTEKCT